MAYVSYGEKQNVRAFKDAGCLKAFDTAYENESNYRIVWRMWFTSEQADQLMQTARKEIKEFHRSFTYFEDLKVSRGIEKLPDGFTHKPVFLIRNLLRQLPAYYVAQTLNRVDDESAYLPDELFLRVMAASYVGKRDLQLTPSRSAHVKNFQQCYLRLIAALGEPIDESLKTLQERSAIINHRHRLTGDALVYIIEEVIAITGKINVHQRV